MKLLLSIIFSMITVVSFSQTWVEQDAPAGFWTALAEDKDGNVYASNYGVDIYKQTGGTGTFVAMGQPVKNWYALLGESDGDVYAGTSSGQGIWKLPYGGTDFVLQYTLAFAAWSGFAEHPNGDIYACKEASGGVYKQTGGTGNFNVVYSGTSYSGIAIDPNTGDIYAAVTNGVIRKNNVDWSVNARGWRSLVWHNGAMYSVAANSVYKINLDGTDEQIYVPGFTNIAGITVTSNGDFYLSQRATTAIGKIYKLAATPATQRRIISSN